MRYAFAAICILPVAVCISTARSDGSESTPTEYDQLLEQLVNLQPDESKVGVVGAFTLSRDVGTFTFTNGSLYLCQPVRSRVVAALFVGKGEFMLTPPTRIEREQVERFFGAESLRQEFTELFLMFADTTAEELVRVANFTNANLPATVKTSITSALKDLGDASEKMFDPDLMTAFLHNEQNNNFFARMKAGVKPYYFRINPFDVEEVQFSQQPFTTARRYHETVARFHTAQEYRDGRLCTQEEKNRHTAADYKIDARITSGLDFSATASFVVTSYTPDLRWMNFWLFRDLKVDSVVYVGGGHAPFVNGDKSGMLWVQCPKPLNTRQQCSLRVYYRGDLLARGDTYRDDVNLSGLVFLRAPTLWYPRGGYDTKSSFDLTFRIANKFSLVSVGDPAEVNTGQEETITRWKTASPIFGASFNIGIFERETLPPSDIPRVTILNERNAQRLLRKEQVNPHTGETVEGSAVAIDVSNSALFCQNVFGKLDIRHLYATEIPFMHGQAFPGLIHLPWITYRSVDLEKQVGKLWKWVSLDDVDRLEIHEMIRAHEVAHQWWGIGVDFKTYHDQWISEGFSTFSSLWYMQTTLQNNKLYFKVLEKWRDDILGNRKYLFGSGQESGPIWLGYRTEGTETYGDYSLIIYKKGAWVLHMLRNMMLDLKTMNEDRFTNMMRDFFTSYKGKKASTEDFQAIVSKHAGTDMSWFFNQWVKDTRIPKYTFSYTSEQTPDGKYRVTYRVRQEDVPPEFKMVVPLLVKFDDAKIVRLRIFVTNNEGNQQLPLLPLAPREIIFNDLQSVLCEVDYEKWE